LNSHVHKGHYALNVARLPFRHFGNGYGLRLRPSELYLDQAFLAIFCYYIYPLLPNILVPIRTMLAPSSMAIG
jgi:hypothetical protein